MKAARKPKIRGELSPWSDAEIARRAEVTEEDKVSALAFWEASAPRPMKELLRAKKRKEK